MFDAAEWQAISGAASVFVAVVALVFAIRTDRRSEKRVSMQSAPVLSLYTLVFLDHRGIRLANNGLGPSRIKSVRFERKGRTDSTCAAEVLDIPELKGRFSDYRVFTGPDAVLAAGDEINVLDLDEKMLIQVLGFEPAKSRMIMDKLGEQIMGMQITVEHQDIFGERQPSEFLSR